MPDKLPDATHVCVQDEKYVLEQVMGEAGSATPPSRMSLYVDAMDGPDRKPQEVLRKAAEELLKAKQGRAFWVPIDGDSLICAGKPEDIRRLLRSSELPPAQRR